MTVLALVLAACADESSTQDTPAVSQSDEDVLAGVVHERLILYIEATDSAIQAERQQVSADDFAVIADDLMFYRATAIEHLDSLPHAFLRISGRRPLVFRVAGQPRSYDFRDVELLDFIVLYEPDQEPRVLAPNEVDIATEFFGTTGG